MSMNMVGGDPEAIKKAADDFKNNATQLDQLINDVHSNMEGLSGLWVGPAHAQFVDLMAQWKKDITNIHQALTEVATRVDKAGIGYHDLEQDIKRSFTLS